VVQDTWQEAGLCRTQHKTQDVELRGCGDKHGQARQDAPGNHDAGNPQLGAHTFQNQVAGYLEQDVTQKEQARAQAVRSLAPLQMNEHLQLGKAYVDSVQIRSLIKKTQEWDQTPDDLLVEMSVSVPACRHSSGTLEG